MSITNHPLFYIVIWVTCSCAMILFNKAVLSSFNFPFPMFLTTWHMLFATVLTQVLSRTTNLLPAVKTANVDAKVMKTQIFPVALCFAISLIMSNKAYIYLSVSFIQMLKASTPVFVLVLSVLLGLERSTFLELNIVTIISLAVAITSIGELRFDFTGFVIQLIGILTESSRLVLTNILLKKLKLDSLSTLYYVAPACFVLNGLACLYFESSILPWDRIMSFDFLFVLFINGIVAFSLNVALVLVISHSSALALALAGIVKDILLVTLSMVIFQSPISMLQGIGYAIALLALNLHKEFKKLPAASAETVKAPVPSVGDKIRDLELAQLQTNNGRDQSPEQGVPLLSDNRRS